MTTEFQHLEQLISKEYQHGFVTDIEMDMISIGLNEEVVRLISQKKKEPEFMLEWRLKAFRHWLTMKEPHWAHLNYKPVDYQAIRYYAAPKSDSERPKSLDEIDPEILKTYEKLGIPLREQEMLAGVAVDAVFDSTIRVERGKTLMTSSDQKIFALHIEEIKTFLRSFDEPEG